MSNLTNCKDCGHQVGKRAKSCPSCGVSKPGIAPTSFAKLYLIAVVIFVGGTAYVNYLDGIGELSGSTVSQQQTFSDAQIHGAVEKSDDFDQHSAAFAAAAKSLLTSRKCGLIELKEHGGFVKAQGDYKNQSIYFTYCGGSTVANRIYFDVSTGRIFK